MNPENPIVQLLAVVVFTAACAGMVIWHATLRKPGKPARREKPGFNTIYQR